MEQAYPPPMGFRLAEKVIRSMLPVGLIISGGRASGGQQGEAMVEG